MPKPRTPIEIPVEISQERAIRNLITQWRNLHLRHRECRKRISWRLRKASILEKRRRKEKWELVARVLEIENTVIAWCARITKHHDIHSSKKGKTFSRLTTLRQQYDRNCRRAHNLSSQKSALRTKLRERRIAIVAEMRATIRDWMVAVFAAVYPEGKAPKALPLHPAELVPRKLKRAKSTIKKELAA